MYTHGIGAEAAAFASKTILSEKEKTKGIKKQRAHISDVTSCENKQRAELQRRV